MVRDLHLRSFRPQEPFRISLLGFVSFIEVMSCLIISFLVQIDFEMIIIKNIKSWE